MLTESYVSFETAKLLKEKGFSQDTFSTECKTCYKWNGKFCKNVKSLSGADREICFMAPTHQMALKWLREVHNQIIIIKYGNVGFVEESILQWWWELLNTKGELHACNIVDGNKSYEEACEDSILYVLKNLI